jgi:hypothetical protein
MQQSGAETTTLLATLRRWQDTECTDGVYWCAAWLYSCGDALANDLLESLARDETMEDLAVDEALRRLARHRFDDLVEWCLQTVTRLDGSLTTNPGRWLPELIRTLDDGVLTLNAALHRVVLADMWLMTCSDETLIDSAAVIRLYQTRRQALLAAAAQRN